MKQLLPSLTWTSFAAVAVFVVACNPSNTGKLRDNSPVINPADVAKAAAAKAAAEKALVNAIPHAQDNRTSSAKACYPAVCAAASLTAIANFSGDVPKKSAQQSDDFYETKIKPVMDTLLKAEAKNVQTLKDHFQKTQDALKTITLTASQERYVKAKLYLLNPAKPEIAKNVGGVDTDALTKLMQTAPNNQYDLAMNLRGMMGVESYLRTIQPGKSLADAAADEATYIKTTLKSINDEVFGEDAMMPNALASQNAANIEAAIAKKPLTLGQIQNLSIQSNMTHDLEFMMSSTIAFPSTKTLQAADLQKIVDAIGTSADIDENLNFFNSNKSDICDDAYYNYIATFPADLTSFKTLTDSVKTSALTLVASDDKDTKDKINAFAFKTDTILAQTERQRMLDQKNQFIANLNADTTWAAAAKDDDVNLVLRLLTANFIVGKAKGLKAAFCPHVTVSFDDMNVSAPIDSAASIAPFVATDANSAVVLMAHDLGQIMGSAASSAQLNTCVQTQKLASVDDSPELADSLSVQILNRWAQDNKDKAAKFSLNYACFVESVQNPQQADLASSLLTTTGTPMKRILEIQQTLGQTIPDSCQAMVKEQKLTLPAVCK